MQDSKVLRHVDRHIGQAACCAISLIRAALPKQKKASHPQRILLLELFEMGAAIMLQPSIRFIKEQYPDAEIHCLTTSSCLPIWKALGVIDTNHVHVISARSPINFVFSFLKTLLGLRKFRFDLVIDYELFMRISAIFVGLLKTAKRAGFYRYNFEGLYRGSFYDHHCANNQNTHIAKNYLALTKTALFGTEDTPNFKGSLTKDEIEIRPTVKKASDAEIAKILGEPATAPYFVVCPDVGETLAMRNWPKEYFARLIDLLLKKHGNHRVIFVGTESDSACSTAILKMADESFRCKNLCGKTNFEELLSLISRADLVITNDNGPGHFAALTGTKALALFSTDSPYVYGPLGDSVIAYSHYHCSPCISAYSHKRSSCDNNKCLQAIPPEKVALLANQILEGTARFRTINNETNYVI